MSPVLLCSRSVILGAAMAVSGAVILISLIFPATHLPENQSIIRPCLSNGGGRKKEKKKLRVRFADNVKAVDSGSSRGEISAVDRKMPDNRTALYHGILRDRVHVQRMASSY